MEFGELRFVLANSMHQYGVQGRFKLLSDDRVTKRAVIELDSSFEKLPFKEGEINLTVEVDEEFKFECTRVNYSPDTQTIDLVVARTAV